MTDDDREEHLTHSEHLTAAWRRPGTRDWEELDPAPHVPHPGPRDAA